MSLEDILGKDGKPVSDTIKRRLPLWLEQLKECYKYWKKNEKKEQFTPGYLQHDERLNKKLNNLGKNVCQTTRLNLGNIDRLVEQAPKCIQKDFKKRGYTVEQAKEDLKTCYNFWKKNEKKEQFTPGYIAVNKRLNKKLNKLGKNLYINTLNNLGNIDALVEQAPKYIQKDYKRKKYTAEKALEELKTCYNFWKENETEKQFTKGYIENNVRLNKKLNRLGRKLYVNTLYNLGSMDALTEQAPKYIQQAYFAKKRKKAAF